jgi:hypothetical protein
VEKKVIELTAAELDFLNKLKEREKEINRLKEEERRKKAEQARQEKIKSELAGKFDMENIQLAAAARNATTADEKARVAALQAIKTEGYQDDEKALQKLIALDKARADAIKNQTADLARLKVEIPVHYVTKGGVEIPSGSGMSNLPTPSQRNAIMGTQPSVAPGRAVEFGLPAPIPLSPELYQVNRGGEQMAIQVYVDVQGNIFTEQELVSAIASGLYEVQRSGTTLTLPNLGR